jgi:hypothetical protein
MKIRLIVLSFLILSINGILYSQDLNPKYYSDYDEGFSGYSIAKYLGEIDDSQIKELINSLNGTPVNKLTRNNFWLCWKALEEWDYEDGETYFVICLNSLTSDNGIIIIATITDGGESFEWYAQYITGSDFE